MGKWLLGLILGTTLVTIALLYPYSVNINDALPNSVDPVFYAWNLAHNIQSVRHGFKNLLDTNIFYPEGNTLALSDTLYAQTFITAPIVYVTQNPVLAQNLYILVTFPLAAISMAVLTYYLTGSPLASIVSSVFYAFSYPRLSQIGHMPALSSQWLPLVFLYAIKYIREYKLTDLVKSFFWFMITTASTLYFGIFLIPFISIVILFEFINYKQIHIRRIFRDIGILIIPAIIIMSILLFPYIRLRAEYPGIRRSLEDAARLSATPIDYLSVLPTNWLSDIGMPTNTNERSLYPTITLLILAILSLFTITRKTRRTVISFATVTIFAFILSLGPVLGTHRMPYYYLYKILPLFESIRVPARMSIFVVLGLSVLAAYTITRIKNSSKAIIISLLSILVFLTEVWQVDTPFIRIPIKQNIPKEYIFLDKISDEKIIAELPLIPEWDGKRMEDQLMIQYEDATQYDIYALEAYRTYFSTFHRKRMLNGYSGYFPNIYHDNSIALASFPSKESISVLTKQGVSYVLVHRDQYRNIAFLDIERKIREYPQLSLVSTFGNTQIYELVK